MLIDHGGRMFYFSAFPLHSTPSYILYLPVCLVWYLSTQGKKICDRNPCSETCELCIPPRIMTALISSHSEHCAGYYRQREGRLDNRFIEIFLQNGIRPFTTNTRIMPEPHLLEARRVTLVATFAPKFWDGSGT